MYPESRSICISIREHPSESAILFLLDRYETSDYEIRLIRRIQFRNIYSYPREDIQVETSGTLLEGRFASRVLRFARAGGRLCRSGINAKARTKIVSVSSAKKAAAVRLPRSTVLDRATRGQPPQDHTWVISAGARRNLPRRDIPGEVRTENLRSGNRCRTLKIIGAFRRDTRTSGGLAS